MRKPLRNSVEQIETEMRSLAYEAGEIAKNAYVEKRSLTPVERHRIKNLKQQIEDARSHLPAPDSRRAGQEDFGTERIERRSGDEPKTAGHLLLEAWLRGPYAPAAMIDQLESRKSEMEPLELRALTTASATATVPTEVDSEVVLAMQDYSGILSIARIDQTPDGSPKKYASADDTGNSGELRAENATISGDVDGTESDPDLSPSKTLLGYPVDSGVLKVTNEELADSLVDVMAMIIRCGTERVGRKIASYLGGGTDSSQPTGIKSVASVGPTTPTGSPTTFAYSDMVGLLHSVDPAYRKSPSCGWAMNDASVKTLRLLVDGASRPLIQGNDTGIEAPQPLRLLGFPVTPDNSLPTLAASAKGVYFGAWDRFVIRLAGRLTVTKLVERYAHKNQVGFIVSQRIDSALLDVKAIKYLLQSAS